VHCDQAVLASNSFGSFKDISWLTIGTPKNSVFGVGLTPRRRLNSATVAFANRSLKEAFHPAFGFSLTSFTISF